MKKYLKLLYIALFAMMSVSLTACGDDDDEPDGGSNNKGVVGELTIDGQKKSFVYITGDTSDNDWGVQYTAMMYTKHWEDVISFQTLVNIADLSSGMTLTEDMCVLEPFMANTLQSGNVHVDKKTKDSITLTFNKAVFKEFNGNRTTTYEGTIKLPINGEYGDALSSMW